MFLLTTNVKKEPALTFWFNEFATNRVDIRMCGLVSFGTFVIFPTENNKNVHHFLRVDSWFSWTTDNGCRGATRCTMPGAGTVAGRALRHLPERRSTNVTRFMREVQAETKAPRAAVRFPPFPSPPPYAWRLSNATRYTNPVPMDRPQGPVMWVTFAPANLSISPAEETPTVPRIAAPSVIPANTQLASDTTGSDYPLNQ